MTHKKLFWFRKISCLLLAFLLVMLTAVPSISASSAESDSGYTTETASEATAASEPSAQTEEPENTTYANSISGILWIDANNDGTHDAGEQPIVGYIVSLYAENDMDNAVQTAVTAADGTYSFFDITPRSYVVGVASATVGGQEYLLPLVGIQNDNKFAIASDSINAYSEPISVGGDSTVTGIDAGMRTPPGVQTRSTVSYIVTSNTGYSATQTSLWGVAGWISWDADTTTGNSGTEYTIEVQGSGIETGRFNLNSYSALSGLNITVTSATTTPYTITAQYIEDYPWLFNMGNNNLTLKNITLDGNKWNSYASSGISMTGGTLTMSSGSTIQNFYSVEGAVSLSNSIFNMDGGTITGNLAYSNGAGILLTNSTFTMNDGTISGNTASYNSGGGVYLAAGSTFTMNGGTISGNTATYNGGGVRLEDSTFTMNGGIITGNTATGIGDNGGNGGGVHLKNSTFNMQGGTISSNEAANGGSGGGVATGMGGTFKMFGGTIGGTTSADANKATYGGGVFITAVSWDTGAAAYALSSFTMGDTGATISGNTAVTSGGGVYVTGNCVFSMKAGLIDNNTATNGSGGGVYVFYQDTILLSSGNFTLSGGTISNNKALGNEHSKGGGIAFASELVLSDNFIIPATLKGGTIGSGNQASMGGGIGIVNNSANNSVTLSVSGTKITENEAIALGTSGNYLAGDGGGIGVVNGGGAVNLIIEEDTNITKNKAGSAGNGGGVYCEHGISFEMNGGTIDGNEATYGSGGGVFFFSGNSASFTMSNGTISNNKSSWAGGGLFIGAVDDATISGSGITISGNIASERGGGISFEYGTSGTGTLEISGGTKISNNGGTNTNNPDSAAIQGGGIYIDANASAEIFGYDTEISGNIAQEAGGGIYSGEGTGTLKIHTDAVIEDNRAGWRGGGGIFVNKGVTLTITDGKIQSNKNLWQGNGGGVYIADGGKANITTSTISGNSAPSGNGGGIYVDNAPYSYSNLTIDSNTTFSKNSATSWYQPPTDAWDRYYTIDNQDYSEDMINGTLIFASPLNNYDINLVEYRVILTFDDSSSDNWSLLGNIAVTFTGNNSKQTAIFSQEIEEYYGYPLSVSSPSDPGIERLSTDSTWDVKLNLPYGYTYAVYYNSNSPSSSVGNLVTIGANVNYIEIKVTKTDPPWGKWIYKFKQ